MADPKTTSVKLTNIGTGPRSFWDADGNNKILRPGETFDGKVFEAELGDLSPDLSRDGPLDESERVDPNAPAPGSDDAGVGYAAGDGDTAALIQTDAETLVRAHTRDELASIAKAEKIGTDSDDNKNDLALKIARARAGIPPDTK